MDPNQTASSSSSESLSLRGMNGADSKWHTGCPPWANHTQVHSLWEGDGNPVQDRTERTQSKSTVRQLDKTFLNLLAFAVFGGWNPGRVCSIALLAAASPLLSPVEQRNQVCLVLSFQICHLKRETSQESVLKSLTCFLQDSTDPSLRPQVGVRGQCREPKGSDAVGGCGTAEGSVGTEHCRYGCPAQAWRLDMRVRVDRARDGRCPWHGGEHLPGKDCPASLML